VQVDEARRHDAAAGVDLALRAMAREQIEQAVQRLVPDLAEAQIKAEITRLTAA